MKLVKKIRLAFQENKSDKVYEVDLVELSTDAAARYLVNFRYGRRGRELREGTKTEHPVTLSEAETLYQSVVVSKTNKGYCDESNPSAPRSKPEPRPAKPVTAPNYDARFAVILSALEKETNSKQRARRIWNLGNSALGESFAAAAIKAVTANVKRGDWREDYSIAWTLGRWRDGNTVAILEQLQRHAEIQVKELALEALLLTVAPARATVLLQPELAELPAPLRSALDERNEAAIVRILQQLVNDNAASLNRQLAICYRLAIVMPALHRALLSILSACPLQPGNFKAVRHIFKTAEMRIDHEVFACLTHRLETTKEFFRRNWDWAFIPGQGSISVSKELPRENSRLAYSQRTRLHLRKRAWRTLLRLGRAGSTQYVLLAKSVLLRMQDSDAVKARKTEVYRWSEEDESRKVVKREYDEFAPFLAFNHILRGAGGGFKLNASGNAWYRSGKANAQKRAERFPNLWDRNLNAALDLLRASRCAPVHETAIKILSAHPEFLSGLSGHEIAELLQSPYPPTTQFALPLAEAFFARGQADDVLLLALLRSPLKEANEFGLRALTALPDIAKNQALLVELLLIQSAPVSALVADALGRVELSAQEQQSIATALVTQLLARDIHLDTNGAEALARLMVQRLPTAVREMPLTLIDRLLSQTEPGRQLLGARLLAANVVGFRDIPGRLLERIHGSEHEQVRAVAIALLNKQSVDELIAQTEMLIELYYRGAAAERKELLQVFARLAASSPDNQLRVLSGMLNLVFRSEHDQGQAEELIEFFGTRLMDAAKALDKNTVWRMLQAQSVIAQKIGSALLIGRPAGDFSVRQWAKLAQHADLAAREFVMRAYESHIDLIKRHTRDALRLLDSKWDNVREFGFRYFRERYADADWSPEFIVGVCDSTVPAVQDFGRELLQRFFEQQQGPYYLAALSEHPSVNVQLFVSHFLETHATGHPDRVLGLRGFFVTVLSHINKARVCKDRVLGFLLREALRDRQVAVMAGEIFTRLSLTVVDKDRTQLIKAMIALQASVPDLSLPLKALPVRKVHAAGGNNGMVSNGV